MTHTLNADLHCHSILSDGTLTPEALALRAFKQGVVLWSLTDHDELGGQERARVAAEGLGLRYCTGVEISVTWAHHTLHIVGLHFDPLAPALVNGLAAVRAGRIERAQRIARELEQVGIGDTYQGALRYADNPEMISRTHFARHLIERGVCTDISDVFARYLSEGNPGYVPHAWASLSDAVHWIIAAGGVAVIAHPGRYKLSALQAHVLYEEFKALGGIGIEVVTGSHSVDQYREYTHIALDYGFLASRGSDFHGPQESRIELGHLPPLSTLLMPIWHHWV
ncbi:MAG: PHP domain-containing protein [Ottowia sp.]|nr:PHP domain-containing protein [Ottowia sp.]